MVSAHLSKVPVVTVVHHYSRTRKWTKYSNGAPWTSSHYLKDWRSRSIGDDIGKGQSGKRGMSVRTESRMSGASAMKAEWVTSRLYVETGRT